MNETKNMLFKAICMNLKKTLREKYDVSRLSPLQKDLINQMVQDYYELAIEEYEEGYGFGYCVDTAKVAIERKLEEIIDDRK